MDDFSETEEFGAACGDFSGEEEQSCEDGILILMKAESCTVEQLEAILKKYELTLLCEGSVIPYCTVRLAEPLSGEELEEMANRLMMEEGIASAMLSGILNTDL